MEINIRILVENTPKRSLTSPVERLTVHILGVGSFEQFTLKLSNFVCDILSMYRAGFVINFLFN